MKKLILSLIVLFTINICFSQNKKSLNKTSIETVYNDSKNGISTVYNDLKSTTPQIKNALESLSKELKTTTDSLWFILVKQQLVWSWCFLILTITSLSNWFIFYKRNLNNKLSEKNFVKGEKDIIEDVSNPNFDIKYYDRYVDKIGDSIYKSELANIRFQKTIKSAVGKEEILIPIININNNWFKYLHLTICIGLSGLSIYHFSNMLTGFLNPEFGALKTITEVVKNLK